ncbi:glycoside hydrolase [Sulfolobus acidocaldarius SUSAZ]|nr:glycoside hydrolase [Sulfolobus acidocaldarius SUSAZ]
MNYALLSNGITTALEKEGSIEWFPVPKFDSPSVFTKILDEDKGGYFLVTPEKFNRVKQHYVEYSLILRTEFDDGNLILIDFLPLSLPAIIRVYEAKVPFNVEVKPLFNYGLVNAGTETRKDGIIYKNPESKEGLELLINGDYKINSPYRITVNSGKGYLYLLYSRDLRYGLFSQKGFVYSEPYEAYSKLLYYSRKELERARRPTIYENAFYRSLSVILGLIYKPSGGIIASPTTSIPEIVGDERNWDYRYVWVRDSSYAIEALVKANLITHARRALDFLTNLLDPSSKSFDHPFYSVDGTPPPAEENLDWLSGFMNSKPVRIGNAAYLQIQMDIEGAYMNALYEYYKRTLDKDYVSSIFWAVEAISDWVSSSWRGESTDIWEERGISRHYTHTKLMSWVALDRASKLAKDLGYNKLSEEWKSRANEIKIDILSNGVKDSHHFVRYYGGDEIDAALLTLPLYDFIPATDSLFMNTLKKIEEELRVADGLYLRYKKDFMGLAKNPFTLVTTWMARVYIRLKEFDRARWLLETLIMCNQDLGLIGEHVDPETCEARGNYPHLFPHSGMVLSILEFDEVR